MKWIKTYESRFSEFKSLNKNRLIEWVEDIRLDWEISDERYAITYDEFLKDFPFHQLNSNNYDLYDEVNFGYPSNTKYPSSGNFIEKLNTDFYYFNSRDFIRTPIGFENDFEYFKRNLIYYVSLNTSGSSGGSCWSDESEYYESDKQLDLNVFLNWFKPKLKMIIDPHANMKSESELIELIKNTSIIKEGEYTNYEYYGNYDTYQCYYFTLFDLFKFLGDNSTF
jgi:hypothetical protein